MTGRLPTPSSFDAPDWPDLRSSVDKHQSPPGRSERRFRRIDVRRSVTKCAKGSYDRGLLSMVGRAALPWPTRRAWASVAGARYRGKSFRWTRRRARTAPGTSTRRVAGEVSAGELAECRVQEAGQFTGRARRVLVGQAGAKSPPEISRRAGPTHPTRGRTGPTPARSLARHRSQWQFHTTVAWAGRG